MKKKIIVLGLLFVTFYSQSLFSQIRILSGPIQGSYFEFIDDINNVMKDTTGNEPFINMATMGAASNFDRISDPLSEYKVALMQLDYLFFMQGMDVQNNIQRTKDIKVLMPLANEEIHIVTKKKSGLEKLSDINSSTVVGIGDKSQGTYATAFRISEMGKFNWISKNYPFDNVLRELVLDRLDAFVFVGSAPVVKLDIDSRGLREPITLLELDDFEGSEIYKRDTIHKEDYKWLDKDIPTFGVRTVMIVNEAKLTKEDKVALKKMMESIRENKSRLEKYGHPKWREVDIDDWNSKDWPIIKL
jgi:TRAP-type uncharacterized transport system substrate-binding protein